MGLRGLPRGTRSHQRRRLTGCRLCGNIALAAAAALFRDSSILRATSNLNPAEKHEAAQQAGAQGAQDARPGRDGCGPRPQGHIAGGWAPCQRVCAARAPGPTLAFYPVPPAALPSAALQHKPAVSLLPAAATVQVAPWLKPT